MKVLVLQESLLRGVLFITTTTTKIIIIVDLDRCRTPGSCPFLFMIIINIFLHIMLIVMSTVRYKEKNVGLFHNITTQFTNQPPPVCMKIAELLGVMDVNIDTNFEQSLSVTVLVWLWSRISKGSNV
jgi:hypothetical protein